MFSFYLGVNTMFDADRPIQNSAQDRLGRSMFSKYLARAILDQVSTESFTIGLYGGSGAGKTSVINLILEELRYASNNMFDHEKPIILNYSPWSYSGQNVLIYSFFRRLTSEMRNAEFFNDPGTERIIYLMELYISFFTHKSVPKSLRPKKTWFSKLFRKKEAAIGWESGRDLTKVKAELNELLAAQSHKLIIFIDNISRLPANEIFQIFQIVKSIGDFTNTIYVLALDKYQVIDILPKVLNGINAPEYLEKVIQLPFDIPPISKQDIETLLLDRLEKIILFAPDNSWDAEYWADIYYSTLKYFFENCRDITRYINTLSFSFMHVREVVNPVDFFAITAVEVFEPNVYNGIRDNKDLFVELFDTVYQFDKEKLHEDKLRIDEILHRAERIPPEMLELLCIRLFPRLRNIYENYRILPHSEIAARKYKRICTYDLFEVYFRLSVSAGYITDSELDTLLELTKDATGFQLALLRLNQDERILKLLDVLDSIAVHRIPKQNIANVIDAFIDTADLFPQGVNDSLHLETPQRIHRIIHQLLSAFDTSEKRFKILYDAIQHAVNSLYIIAYEIAI
ncbi:MAG TPA: P-loop NTPase fold protein, partial [Gammaproteobacteria bacterium]|nr:P-loop NTPase fold protein [Gammaproteobacteria bacterium]